MKSELYRLEESMSDPVAGSGFMEIAADGQARRIAWTLPDETGDVRHYRGVGFWIDKTLVTARSRASISSLGDGQALPAAGVVVYDIADLGRLPARWYHADLAGLLGKGLSTGGLNIAFFSGQQGSDME